MDGFMGKIFFIALFCFFYLTTQSLAETVMVISPRANLRSGPGMKYKLVERLKKGESLDVLEKKGDWVRIRRKGGKEGWIHRLLVNAPPAKTLQVNRNREIIRKKPDSPETRSPKRTQTKIQGGFVPKKVRLTERFGMVRVTGEMTNRSVKDYFAAGFIISLYDAKDRLLGTGDILIDEFPKGKTKSFTTYVEVSYQRVHRYNIRFDFGI
jgi:uncharacterized protein YgiM (DUF1202 family)